MNARLIPLALALAVSGCSTTTTDCSTLTDTYANYGQSFFSSTCTTCHEHTSQFTTQSSIQASASSIESEISSGRMPEGTSLSATDKARVLAWLSCGAP